MNYKKFLILFISIFLLIACKKLPVDEIQTKVDKKIYYDALYLMNEKFEKSMPNNEDLERYQKIYNKGKKYYLSKNDLKKAYEMDELYLKLPNRIKEKLPDKERFFREMAVKVLRAINVELQELPDYDFLKIYI